jgi:hypothetical protein
MPQSRLHHYIPQFYIRGFQSAEGFYYVYDKQTDRISRKTSPKQLFFEWDRNSYEEDGEKKSDLEERGYSRFDDMHSLNIKALQTEPINANPLNDANLDMLLYFRTSLFWRIPFTDNGYADLFSKGKVYLQDEQGNRQGLADEGTLREFLSSEKMSKVHRVLIFQTTIEHFRATTEPIKFEHRIYESRRNWFLLGDYPMVYMNQPTSLLDIVTMPLYIPLSSTRVYYNRPGIDLKFEPDDVAALNALIIHQAVRYVCGADRDTLGSLVNFYKMVKEKDLMIHLRKRIFYRGY